MKRKQLVSGNIFIKKSKKKNEKNKDDSSDDSDDSNEDVDIPSLFKNKKDKKIYKDNNHIYFYDELNEDSYIKFKRLIEHCIKKEIIRANKESINYSLFPNINNIDYKPIYIHIHSPGGLLVHAFSIVDLIKNSKIVKINSVIEGNASSAASLISICCHKRYMYQNASVLIHQLSSGLDGKYSDINDEHSNLKNWHKKTIKIYKENTNLSEKAILKHLSNEIEWDAKTCLKYDVVDEIIE